MYLTCAITINSDTVAAAEALRLPALAEAGVLDNAVNTGSERTACHIAAANLSLLSAAALAHQ